MKNDDYWTSGSFRCWRAVVEDRNDPLRLGRCRVRIFGLHSPLTSDIPTADLPWATPMMPVTSAGVSGVGESMTGLVEGSIVMIFFNDGDDMQDPIIMGVLGGQPHGPIFKTASAQVSPIEDQIAVYNDGKKPDGTLVQPLGNMSKLEGRDVNLLVIHCAATTPNMDIGVEEINQWHLARGWKEIGYHSVIRRNGVLEQGRDFSKEGSHVRGWNKHSIGVCMVGGIDQNGNPENNFTTAQWKALRSYVATFLQNVPDGSVCGHTDLDRGKACPSFNVEEWLRDYFPTARFFGGGAYSYTNTNIESDLDYWKVKGYSPAQASAIMANVHAESGGDPMARGDGGKAVGLFQWHPDRQAAILEGTGIDVRTANRQQQFDAAAWEMQNARPAFKDAKFRQITDPAEAAAYFSRYYESPANGDTQASLRGKAASSIYAQFGGEFETEIISLSSEVTETVSSAVRVPLGPSGDNQDDSGVTEGYADDVIKGVAYNNLLYTKNHTGFSDQNGNYPRPTYTANKEPDLNRLARNQYIDQTVVGKRMSGVERDVRLVNEGVSTEPVTPYRAKYPFNHVYETESGHVREYDDTAGAERISEQHRTGTFYEIHPDGSKVTKIVGQNYEIVEKDNTLYIKGTCNISVDGNCNLLVKGNTNIETDGRLNVRAKDDINMVSKGNIKIIGKKVEINP